MPEVHRRGEDGGMDGERYEPREHDELVEPLFAGLRTREPARPPRRPRPGSACLLLALAALAVLVLAALRVF